MNLIDIHRLIIIVIRILFRAFSPRRITPTVIALVNDRCRIGSFFAIDTVWVCFIKFSVRIPYFVLVRISQRYSVILVAIFPYAVGNPIHRHFLAPKIKAAYEINGIGIRSPYSKNVMTVFPMYSHIFVCPVICSLMEQICRQIIDLVFQKNHRHLIDNL